MLIVPIGKDRDTFFSFRGFQEPSSLQPLPKRFLALHTSSLKMEATCYSEIFVSPYKMTVWQPKGWTITTMKTSTPLSRLLMCRAGNLCRQQIVCLKCSEMFGKTLNSTQNFWCCDVDLCSVSIYLEFRSGYWLSWRALHGFPPSLQENVCITLKYAITASFQILIYSPFRTILTFHSML
jgi:hypothetical protein